MKPYPNIQTHNLKLLLLLARITVYIGSVVLIIAIGTGVIAFFTGGLATFFPVLTFTPLAISILFFSGLMAAIVSFEENYRLRTLHLVRNDETKQLN